MNTVGIQLWINSQYMTTLKLTNNIEIQIPYEGMLKIFPRWPMNLEIRAWGLKTLSNLGPRAACWEWGEDIGCNHSLGWGPWLHYPI